jgi:hypothetical protein
MRKTLILIFTLISNYIFAMNISEMEFYKTNYIFNYSMQIKADSVSVNFLCTIKKTNELLSLVFVNSPILKQTNDQLIGDQEYIDKFLVKFNEKEILVKFDRIKNQFDIQSCMNQVNGIVEDGEINSNNKNDDDKIYLNTKRMLQGIMTNICLGILFESILLRDLENEIMGLWNDDMIINSKSNDKLWETRIRNKKDIIVRKMEQRLSNDMKITMSLEVE